MQSLLMVWIIVNIIQIANGTKEDDNIAKEENEAYYNETYTDTSCLFNQEDGTLAFADASNFTLPEDSIFFIETSCKGGLDFRQACSVETAARAHQNRQINVLFAGRDTTEDIISQSFLKTLLTYKNVKFYKIHILNYAKDTPLEELVNGNLTQSRFLLYHTSDVLRFLTLYKFGGIYLDLDVFVVKSLDHLPMTKDWIGKDCEKSLAVGLVALSRTGIGKEIIDATLHYLKTNFTPNIWGANGISVVTKAVEKVCSIKNLKNTSSATCKGFIMYEPRYFYSIGSNDFERFLEPINKTLNLTDVYAIHLWNYLINGEDIYKDSLHAVLTKKYCPKIDKVNYNFTKYAEHPTPSTQSAHPRQMMTIRIQRSKVNTLYDTIEINLRKKLLDMKKYKKKVSVPRKSSHHHYHERMMKSPTRMPPTFHDKQRPTQFAFRETRATKIRWKLRMSDF